MSGRRVARFRFENFRGITVSEREVPPHGLLFKGGVGQGKTSHLHALTAALREVKLGVEVIPRGENKTTLLVAFDDGTTVSRSVTREKGVGDASVRFDKARAGQRWLNDKLGLAAFDVIHFIGAEAKERVRMLHEAIPCTVTVERLREWVPALEEFDCSGHGLEVLRRLHDFAYKRRATANATAKVSRAEADRVAEEASRAAEGVDPNALPLEQATLRATEANATLARARALVEAAKAHDERTVGQRERIARLRANANTSDSPVEATREAERLATMAKEAAQRAQARVIELERQLATARDELVSAEANLRDKEERARLVVARNEDAKRWREQADELEQTIALAAPERPSDEEIEALERSAANIQTWVTAAERAATARTAAGRRDAAEAEARRTKAEADRLDGIVKALANDAPRALLAEAGGIEGLVIDGETIRVDGVSIDSLSSGEQLLLAVKIAKRLNRAHFLIVDHLEHLQASLRKAFLREACADGWQVFATVVDEGELVIEAIEFEEEAA